MTEQDTIDRDEVQRKNSNALSELVRLHALSISNRDFDRWRPTVPTSGYIDGFFDLGNLTCVATDGLQAWFTRESDERPHIGHVQFFRWDVPVIKMVPYMKPSGEVGFFKSVKDQGAPSALYGMPPRARPASERTAKSKRSRKPKVLSKEEQRRQQILAEL